MADERLMKRLEEQLRDAHTTNSELRERLVESEKRVEAANVLAIRGRDALAQLEKAHAKQKAAEDKAAAAQRKREDTEREATKLRGENDELRARLERAQREADKLAALNARLETAKHVHDLFPKES